MSRYKVHNSLTKMAMCWLDPSSSPNTETENEDPLIQQRHEMGAEAFVRFEAQVRLLDEKLHKLCGEARSLGGSAAILSISAHLRTRLGRVLHLFRKNATDLYPEEMQAYLHTPRSNTKSKHQYNFKDRIQDKIRLLLHPDSVDADNMAVEFRFLSRDVKTLLHCFKQLPNFEQELPDKAISKELRHWAKYLDNFEHEFDTLAAQTYLHSSMVDIGDLFEVIAQSFIPVFTEYGIPCIRASQSHDTSNIQNQTIVATLFAGVATGMIQVYTGSDPDGGSLNKVIVLLWYMTLIFSIGSTVNGLLGLSWTQAIYRSPDRFVPWWILIWIKRFPLVFLVLAVACSFVALTLFAFLPQQDLVTLVITTCLSLSSCVGLLVVSGWFICERLIFEQYDGRIWLTDAIDNIRTRILTALQNAWSCLSTKKQEFLGSHRSRPGDIELDGAAVDNAKFWHDVNKYAMTNRERAKYRWSKARELINQDQRRATQRLAPPPSQHACRMVEATDEVLRADALTRLRTMAESKLYRVGERHGSLVRSVQFSPDGHYLLTSGWDSKTFLLRICTDPAKRCAKVLTHPLNPDNDHVHQVGWSPDGKKLLMRSSRNLSVWQSGIPDQFDGKIVEPRKIFEHRPEFHDQVIRGANWNGDGTKIFSIQERRVLTIAADATRQILQDYSTQHLELRDVCVTSDSHWMICVGRYVQEHWNIGRYGIIVWDLRVRKVAKHIPVYHEICSVTLASDDRSVLVSYANKSPSQVWRLMVGAPGLTIGFTLLHSYIPQASTTFAALPSIFGGEHDEFVLRIATTGDIHVWDRDTAEMLYHIPVSSAISTRITSFAWNRASKNYMFAIGTAEGTIHIWTSHVDPVAEDGRGSD